MEQKPYQQTLAKFETIVRNKAKDQTMVALIIDSPWLPGHAGLAAKGHQFRSSGDIGRRWRLSWDTDRKLAGDGRSGQGRINPHKFATMSKIR